MAILVFAAYIVQYMQKMMTSIGIVCMVNQTWVQEYNSPKTQNNSFLHNKTTTDSENCLFKNQKFLTVKIIYLSIYLI
jgi:hypothetical protein